VINCGPRTLFEINKLKMKFEENFTKLYDFSDIEIIDQKMVQ
jgi:hypothetical protein